MLMYKNHFAGDVFYKHNLNKSQWKSYTTLRPDSLLKFFAIHVRLTRIRFFSVFYLEICFVLFCFSDVCLLIVAIISNFSIERKCIFGTVSQRYGKQSSLNMPRSIFRKAEMIHRCTVLYP